MHCKFGLYKSYGSYPSDSFLSRFVGPDHAEKAPTRFVVASGGVLSKGYGMTDVAFAWSMARRGPI